MTIQLSPNITIPLNPKHTIIKGLFILVPYPTLFTPYKPLIFSQSSGLIPTSLWIHLVDEKLQS